VVAYKTWLPLNFVFCVATKQALALLEAQLRSSIIAPADKSPETVTESLALLSATVTLDGHCAILNKGKAISKINT
jgi:hypothetical protein